MTVFEFILCSLAYRLSGEKQLELKVLQKLKPKLKAILQVDG